MEKHTRDRILKEFPCLRHIGIDRVKLAKATITVARLDDALKLARATCIQEGDGVNTDLRYEERRFHGFTEVDPKMTEGGQVVGMTELITASCVPWDESKQTVADMIQQSKPLAVIIETNERLQEFRKPKISIVIHRV